MNTDLGDLRDWTLTSGRMLLLNVVGIALTVVGLVFYLAMWGMGSEESSVELGGSALLVGIGTTIVLVLGIGVVHELVHGVVVRTFGHRPVYGAQMAGKVLPVLYCTAPDARFSRGQFMAVALAPALVLGPVLALAIALLPFGGWLVMPAAIHLGGCVGDLAMTWSVTREPTGTLIEDRKDSLRFFRPSRS